jgi:uncharacterized RDD family membrane protein YckC
VNQPQDSAPAPGQLPEPAAGQASPAFGAGGQPQPEFSAPGQTQPTAYGQPANQAYPGSAPGYGQPANQAYPGSAPGYGQPANQAYPSYPQSGYGQPGNQAYPGYPQSGYGQPGNQAYPGYPQSGYGQPGNQAYPGYPQSGYGQPGNQAYPSYPQPGHGQPYQQPYGYQMAGRDPALAEWWRRLLARVIDGLILAVLFAPLWIPPWRTFVHRLTVITNSYTSGTPAARNAIATAEAHFFGAILTVGLLFYLVAFAYDWIQHAAWGQTIGKRALGTKVVKDDGNPSIGWGAAAGRAAVYALPRAVPLVGGLFGLINELWLTWDPRSQCLHDKAAHTVVIKKDYQLSRPQAGAW